MHCSNDIALSRVKQFSTPSKVSFYQDGRLPCPHAYRSTALLDRLLDKVRITEVQVDIINLGLEQSFKQVSGPL